MRAIQVENFATADGLGVADLPDPVPHPGQVLVEVEAAGLSFADGLIARGQYQIKPPLPFVPGSTFAGTVVSAASESDRHWVGNKVFADGFIGAWATRAVADCRDLVELPTAVSSMRAAAIGESYGTAWFALVERGRIAADDTVLVLGAGSGVGLAAVDVARLHGARTIAVASTDEKLTAARTLGAHIAIATEDLTQLREVAPDGVDLVLDPVGGGRSDAALRALRRGGRYLVVGFASGEIPRLPANRVLLRNRAAIGVDWGDEKRESPSAARLLIDRVMHSIARGELHPPEPICVDLEGVPAALDDIAHGRVVGKIVVVPGRGRP